MGTVTEPPKERLSEIVSTASNGDVILVEPSFEDDDAEIPYAVDYTVRCKDGKVIQQCYYPESPQFKDMPDDCGSITHKFDIAGTEGYLIALIDPDGSLDGISIVISKKGSHFNEMMNSFATAISRALEYNVPLEVLCEDFIGQSFEPRGITKNPDIVIVTSIVDYIFQWLGHKFLEPDDMEIILEKIRKRNA